MSEGKKNPNPGPGVSHEWGCTHNPCRCPDTRLQAIADAYKVWMDGEAGTEADRGYLKLIDLLDALTEEDNE